MYVVHILDSIKGKGPSLKEYNALREYVDLFPNEVPRLSPKREIYLTIDLVPATVLVSKVPYKMSTPKLIDLKIKLSELLESKYIRLSVSA